MNTSVVTPRHSKKERRVKVAKLYHMRKVARAFSGELIFFDREDKSNVRVSNVESMGSVSAFKSLTVKRIQVRPALGTSEADIALLLQHCIFELKVDGDEKAIQLPLQDAPPAAGLGPNTGIPMIGSPEPRGSFERDQRGHRGPAARARPAAPRVRDRPPDPRPRIWITCPGISPSSGRRSTVGGQLRIRVK